MAYAAILPAVARHQVDRNTRKSDAQNNFTIEEPIQHMISRHLCSFVKGAFPKFGTLFDIGNNKLITYVEEPYITYYVGDRNSEYYIELDLGKEPYDNRINLNKFGKLWSSSLLTYHDAYSPSWDYEESNHTFNTVCVDQFRFLGGRNVTTTHLLSNPRFVVVFVFIKLMAIADFMESSTWKSKWKFSDFMRNPNGTCSVSLMLYAERGRFYGVYAAKSQTVAISGLESADMLASFTHDYNTYTVTKTSEMATVLEPIMVKQPLQSILVSLEKIHVRLH